MALVVGALRHSQWQRLSPLLKAMGWDGPSMDAESWFASQLAPSAEGDDYYLLLHSRPERCINNALAEGIDLSSAVSMWEQSAEPLLDFFKRNRSRSVLLDVDAVCENPQAALEWLVENQPQFKTMAERARSQSIKLGVVRDGQDIEQNLNLLVAIQVVAQSPSIQALLPYFDAGSVPVGSQTYAEPVVDLMSTYERIKGIQQGAGLKEENDLVIKELFKVQEELERYYIANKEMQAKLDYSTSEMEKFSRTKQAELTAMRKGLSEKTKKLRKIEGERDELRIALNAIQNSLFWRLTFPLRWLMRKVKRVGRLFGRLFGRRGVGKSVKILQQSDLFDAQWYSERYPDVVSSRFKPEVHYVRFGAYEGRDPGPYFSSRNYLQANPDVAKAGLNPLVHYIKYGKSEGRSLT